MRYTLSNFRAQWPAEAMGICMVDAEVANYCNAAQDRLLLDPLAPDEGWFGGSVTMNLTASVVNGAAYVTVPREICRLVVIGICQQPVRIRNGFYEYLQFGTGLEPKSCQSNLNSPYEAYERDNVVTLSSLLSTPQKIRVYQTDIKDTGLRVLVQGVDQNGMTVLTVDPNTTLSAPGEYMVIKFPYVESVNTFASITGIQKDETYGPLQFFQADPTTGAEVALSSMEPGEQVASYRRYLINGIPAQALCCASTGSPLQITAKGRLEFIPVVNETDYLIIPNVPALVEEAMSIRFARMNTGDSAEKSNWHHGRALALLNGQLDKYHGKVNTAIRVPLFGSNRLTRQPV